MSISPVLGEKYLFLTSFSFLACFRVEIDNSDHFHKIRLKCEIFFPTLTREKGPISCLNGEIVYYCFNDLLIIWRLLRFYENFLIKSLINRIILQETNDPLLNNYSVEETKCFSHKKHHGVSGKLAAFGFAGSSSNPSVGTVFYPNKIYL